MPPGMTGKVSGQGNAGGMRGIGAGAGAGSGLS
jgi:hypothetical protein